MILEIPLYSPKKARKKSKAVKPKKTCLRTSLLLHLLVFSKSVVAKLYRFPLRMDVRPRRGTGETNAQMGIGVDRTLRGMVWSL